MNVAMIVNNLIILEGPANGGSGPPGDTLITTDSTQYTIDTTTLYTIDNNNTTI